MTPISTIRTIVNGMNPKPRFFVGNDIEMAEEFGEIGYSKDNDLTKYPAILMESNFYEQKGFERGIASVFTSVFYFVSESKSDYSVEQRIDNVFDTIIYPLEYRFLYDIFRSEKFVFDNEINIQKVNYIPRKSTNMYNVKSKLNDIIDVLKVEIELKLRN